MQRLTVAENRRYLAYADGAPFFYLGDTAWELFHRLTLEDAEIYFADRAQKGFTVAQAVVLGELNGVSEPNANGDLPFADGDVTRPNERYFAHVDALVEVAARHGMYVGMLPMWGCYWHSASPEKLFAPQTARAYARFLARRMVGKPIIWVLGGDRDPITPEDCEIVRAVAAGLQEGDGGEHLRTFHPTGPSASSRFFHEDDWLDFNMCQSSHAARDHFNGAFIRADRARVPAKPTLDGEPRYEHIPVGFYNKSCNPFDRFDDFDARQAAYFALFSGACGHTYGNNNIWQMYAPGRAGRIGANVDWREALHHPGSRQMGYLKKLMLEADFTRLEDGDHLLMDAPREGGARVLARIAKNRQRLLVYSPYGEPFGLDLRTMPARGYTQRWFNPKYGTYEIEHVSACATFQTFTPPSRGRGRDWVLVLTAREA